MDDWEKFNETPLPQEEAFFSDLNFFRLYACSFFVNLC